jgi:hypothetical protein
MVYVSSLTIIPDWGGEINILPENLKRLLSRGRAGVKGI